jgi:hypothetical protein
MNQDPFNNELEDKKIEELALRLKKEGNKMHPGGLPVRPAVETSSDQNVKPDIPESAEVEEFSKEKISSIVKPLQTYERDIADTIRHKETSVVSINLAEQKRKQESGETNTIKVEKFTKNTVILFLSVILIIVGAGTLTLFYFLHKDKAPRIQPQAEDILITLDSTKEVNLTGKNRNQIIEAVKKELSTHNAPLESIVKLSFVKLTDGVQKKEEGIDEFLSPLSSDAPPSLLRSFDGVWIFGFQSADSNGPFIIAKLSSFENAFDGMLRWENHMAENLGPIIINQEGGPVELKKTFEDEVVNNKDVRVLKNVRGETAIMYSFLNEKTLLITNNERTFKEILNRFLASKLVR